MNPDEMKELKELIEFLEEHKIGEFALERGELKVHLKFQAEGAPAGMLDAETMIRLLGASHAAAPLAVQPVATVLPPLQTPVDLAVDAAAAAAELEEA
ncbi:MAG TPA: acetyl-CoA carboxylase, biotin carboxyl carrier protein, partial [Acidobacteriaceae bacterium]